MSDIKDDREQNASSLTTAKSDDIAEKTVVRRRTMTTTNDARKRTRKMPHVGDSCAFERQSNANAGGFLPRGARRDDDDDDDDGGERKKEEKWWATFSTAISEDCGRYRWQSQS